MPKVVSAPLSNFILPFHTSLLFRFNSPVITLNSELSATVNCGASSIFPVNSVYDFTFTYPSPETLSVR